MIREVSGVLGKIDLVRTLDYHLTIGRWGGSRVVRFGPTGDIDFQIVFPTALNVTACCFGGNMSPYFVSHFLQMIIRPQ
jgi:sugar lactone lactonase YvrE